MSKYILLGILLSSLSYAFPLPDAQESLDQGEYFFYAPDGKLISKEEIDFSGIVKLSNCSGSIIRYVGQPETSKAIVLTNGHCLKTGFVSPGEKIVNKAVSRKMRVSDKENIFKPIKAELLLYATMTGTDMALYQLDETYEQLEKRGIPSFELSTSGPEIGQSISVISGYWETQYLCEVENIAHKVQEGDWFFNNSISYGCNTRGGTSGSPIISVGEKVVVGVNNSRNEDGKQCSINNPCEISKKGEITVKKGMAYGQQTAHVYNCLSPDFTIDLSIPECEL